MSMRKWKAKKNRSFMFLSGYRSGKSGPCGFDRTGFRIYQASLRDCGEGAKNLTFEETIRRYFEPTYIVNTRGHDILADDGDFVGDLGVLVAGGGGGTQARVFAGNPTDKFGAATSTNFSFNFGAILGQGTGNVHAPRFADQGGSVVETDPRAMFSDLFVLTADKLWLARSNGDGYNSPVSRDVSGVTGLVVDDFNGDLLADAGLLGPNGLRVLRSLGDGTFASADDWLSADLTARTFVAAGDFNGDGKADLVVRDADGSYQTALSRATCSDFSAKGLCPAAATGAPGLRDLAAASDTTPWAVTDVKHVVGDFDRDGRDDVLAVVRDGSGIKVMAMRSLGDGTFGGPSSLGAFNVSFDNFTPVAMDINPDSMSDIALVGTSQIFWLRTNERTSQPATMTLVTPANSNGPGAAFKAY
jgi:hypothetical protein